MVNRWTSGLILATALLVPISAQDRSRDLAQKPLVVATQGSFFVGGESKPVMPAAPGPLSVPGEITVNQMYVQYQVPQGAAQHVPVVMVHGCCSSGKTWETTPDGRMGWSEYFARQNRPVYLADQVSRARSGFDASVINAVRTGAAPVSQLPAITLVTHQLAWTTFRFGPRFGVAFPDGQFPVEAAEELYKQIIPDLNSMLPTPNPTWTNMAALAVRLRGAILMGHSQSGFFPQQAAFIDPSGIRGIISIETPCVTNRLGAPRQEVTAAQIATLAKIPTLIVFGDHLDAVGDGPINWAEVYQGCQKFVGQLKAAGGDAEMMHLPASGIKGNSHMLMQDRNNLQIADLVLRWIDAHVEAKMERSTESGASADPKRGL